MEAETQELLQLAQAAILDGKNRVRDAAEHLAQASIYLAHDYNPGKRQ